MGYETVLLPKWFPHQGRILAKEQFHNSYTFWAMPILIFSPFANFGKQSLQLFLKENSHFLTLEFSQDFMSIFFFKKISWKDRTQLHKNMNDQSEGTSPHFEAMVILGSIYRYIRWCWQLLNQYQSNLDIA